MTDACTLPPAEQPLRLAEFDDLFTAALRSLDRASPTRARLHLAGPAGLAETVRDLTEREMACCSYFDFTVAAAPDIDGETVTLEVRVPQQHIAALTALVERATDADDRA
ncbi:hypothetical protein [Actinoplanes philippinensis]|uniref:hypothetical protein n=1 Tax=Actinoplanes philippinensis TaxID=35752 RepID=UPI0033FFA83C